MRVRDQIPRIHIKPVMHLSSQNSGTGRRDAKRAGLAVSVASNSARDPASVKNTQAQAQKNVTM